MNTIVTEENFQSTLDKLEKFTVLVTDVETDGLNPFNGNKLFGIGVCGSRGDVYYFPFRHQPQQQSLLDLDGPKYRNLPEDYMEKLISVMNSAKVLVGYNLKFDLRFLMNEGLEPWDKDLVDGIVAVRLTEPDQYPKMGLTEMIEKSYGKKHGEYDHTTKEVLRKNKWYKDFSLAPIDIIGPYCIEDVYWTRKLVLDRIKQLKDSQQQPVWELEKRLTKVLLRMEYRGISVDIDYCESALEKLRDRQVEFISQIHKAFGKEVKVNSNKQIGEAFNNLGIFSPVKSKAGNQSWDETVLAGINHPVAPIIRGWRSLEKVMNTYIEPFIRTGGTLHSTFANWGTITGRLSSKDPNMQNIPKSVIPLTNVELTEEQKAELKGRIAASIQTRRGVKAEDITNDDSISNWGYLGEDYYEEGNENLLSLRRAFIPREDYTLVSFDYSQMEIRVFLTYLMNKDLHQLMSEGDFDFHSHAAKTAFKIDEDHPEFKFYRQMAKAITFGLIYGIGLDRLATQLGVTSQQAKQYRDNYFAAIPGAKSFMYRVWETAKKRGYVFNRFGRVYTIPQGREYVAINYLVQGTSADILSDRMLDLDKLLENTDSHMLVQVHDEVICEIHNDELDELCPKIKQTLEDNPLDMPLTVDVEVCDPSWATKKDFEISGVA